jgi:hypothetical protein
MKWDKAPRRPRPGEPVRALLQTVAAGLLLTSHPVWWVWALFATITVLGVRDSLRWIRDNRSYNAWVAWDEAGGPEGDRGAASSS